MPGPRALPLDAWDNVVDVGTIAVRGIEEATAHFARKYGGVCRFTNPVNLNGASGWTFVTEPEAVEWICARHTGNYEDRYLPDVYGYVTGGKGILGSQGAYNRRQRQVCSPPFRSPDRLAEFARVVSGRAARLAELWREGAAAAAATAAAAEGGKGGGGEIGAQGGFECDVGVHMQRLTLDVVGAVAFTHDFGQVEGMARLGAAGLTAGEDEIPSDRILHNINVAQDAMGKIFITPLPVLRWLRSVGFPLIVRMEDAFADMRAAVEPLIAARRVRLAEDPASAGGDLLDALLLSENLGDGGKPLTDAELWEDIHDIMGAGHETTASTLTMCLWSVARHPAVRDRLYAELDALAPDPGTLLSVADLDALPFTQAVVKEVLRLYPPIPIFPRCVKDADVLPTGHAVPAGDVIFMSAFAQGRSDAIWEDPMRFDPDRFTPEAEAARHRFAWVPFGAGPRMCMGAGFALMSTSLALAQLLRENHVDALCHTDKTVFPIEYDITMRFPGGVRVRISPREPEAGRAGQVVARPVSHASTT